MTDAISRRRFLASGLATAGGAAMALSPAAGLARTGGGRRPKHVVLVDWDGFDPDYLGRAPTPTLDALARRGSLSISEGTYRTISNPNRASMSTGAFPEVHGNLAYYYDEELDRAMGQSRFLAAETIAQALRAEGTE